MKNVLLAFTLLVLPTFAQADRAIYGLVVEIDQTVRAMDFTTMSVAEKQKIQNSLQEALDALNGRGSGASSLICVVSSNHSGYSRLHNGQKEIGNDSSRDECREVAKSSANGLVCGRSLNHSGYFRVYRVRDGLAIGNDVAKNHCLSAVAKSTRRYVCSVSTNHSGYYSVYDIRTGKRMGGDVSLDNCLQDINLM